MGARYATDEVTRLTLSRREARLLEAQLARALARIEDEIAEARGGHSVLAEELEDLRRVDERLRRVLEDEASLPDIV